MAEYQNYYDYNYYTDKKEDATQVKKFRESLRKNFPPSIRRQIEQELEQDDERDVAPVTPDVNQPTLSHLMSLFHKFEGPSFQGYQTLGNWYTTPKQQPELSERKAIKNFHER